MVGIKVMGENNGKYIDFIVSEDGANLYRYYKGDNEFHKTMGFGRLGNAVRGKKRATVLELAKICMDGKLPFAMSM